MKDDIAARLAKIAREDGTIGAFWALDPQAASRIVVEGKLSGVSLGVKDNVDVAGLPTTAGIAAFRHRIASSDAPAVAGLKRAGAVVLGKLAMHEGALGATTDTLGFGRCMNPLRAGYTPGGSSGGSGAAVAAGFTTLAIGTDTMGSVRIPAAYCGVVGLKPTSGLVSRRGVMPLSPSLDHVGMLAASPRLAAMGLEAMIGEDAADPASRPAPAGWHAVPPAQLNPSAPRLGLPQPVLDALMEDAIRVAWGGAIAHARDLGWQVGPISVVGWEPSAARRAGLLLIEAEAAALHAELIDDPQAATPDFRSALAFGRDAGTTRLMRAMFRIAEVRGAVLRALDTCDVLLLPTAPQRAFLHGTKVPPDQADFCAPANMAGLPAIAFPWPAADGGLPCSIQLIGRPYAEAQLVALAEALSAP